MRKKKNGRGQPIGILMCQHDDDDDEEDDKKQLRKIRSRIMLNTMSKYM